MNSNPILVVDDSPFMLRTLTFILEKAGHATATAANGEEALAKARELRPRMILLDAVMPDMTGPQVLEALRNDPNLRDIPVVIVSGSEADELPQADGFIKKPFKPEEVLSTVEKLALKVVS